MALNWKLEVGDTMAEQKHYCNPKDGKLNFEKPTEFKSAIQILPEGRHVLTIKKYSQRRSNGANSYYWKIVIPYFCQEWGLDPKIKGEGEYMHYDILGQELRQIPDERRPGKTRTQQTSTMNGSEFWKYIHQFGRLYFHNFNGAFPPPKSLGYDVNKK